MDEKSTHEGERIAKVLSRHGIASRRGAEQMILDGEISVNGQVIHSPALNVSENDRILVRGIPLPQRDETRLWLYHKPAGLVTSAADEKGRETIFDRLPPDLPRLMPIGRLDLNSEGLLLLTNDGEIKRRLELPATGWLRRYRVRVHGRPDEPLLDRLRAGITIDAESFQPMQVAFDRQQGANAWLTVGLREGRNREVRRAMEAIGLRVSRLIRISYGPFQLGKLETGAVSEVPRQILHDQLGLPSPAAPNDAADPSKRLQKPGKPATPGTRRPATEGAPKPPRRRRPERTGKPDNRL